MDSEKYWLIVFEDADRKNKIFTDEEIARKTYAMLLDNWNCHLFEQVSNNGKAI